MASPREELTNRQQDALDVLEDEPAVNPSLVADRLGIHRQNAYRYLNDLVDDGLAEKIDDGLYTRRD